MNLITTQSCVCYSPLSTHAKFHYSYRLRPVCKVEPPPSQATRHFVSQPINKLHAEDSKPTNSYFVMDSMQSIAANSVSSYVSLFTYHRMFCCQCLLMVYSKLAQLHWSTFAHVSSCRFVTIQQRLTYIYPVAGPILVCTILHFLNPRLYIGMLFTHNCISITKRAGYRTQTI